LKDEEKEKYKKFSADMRVMTWGLHNDIQELGVEHDTEGKRFFNYKKFKEIRMEKLLMKWNMIYTVMSLKFNILLPNA
jgi:hypothetical protein